MRRERAAAERTRAPFGWSVAMAISSAASENANLNSAVDETRRDFIFVAAGAAATVGLSYAAWPFIDQMNPSADTRALATTDIDLTQIGEGQEITVRAAGKSAFVRHRTQREIEAAEHDDFAHLKDPASDASRLAQKNGAPGRTAYLIVWSACTHLGCIPLFAEGEFGGWRCPCHGSVYDTSGRIRSGPAPKNLFVAPYVYTGANAVRIG